MSASAGPGGIVYEQFGQVHIYDIASGKEHAVNIEIAADLTEVRPHFQNVSRELRNAAHLAHRRARGLRSARRNPHRARREGRGPQSDQHARRDGARRRRGRRTARPSPTSPTNPASTRCTSSRRTGRARRRRFRWPASRPSTSTPSGRRTAKPSRSTTTWTTCGWWRSPRGKADQGGYRLSSTISTAASTGPAIRSGSRSSDSCPTACAPSSIYSVETGKSVQVTDGMSDARRPAFDRDGQYLYFTASTNYGPTTSGLDMTSDEHEVTSSVYLVVLPNNIASPLAPESDEEKARRVPRRRAAAADVAATAARRGGAAAPETPPKPVRIDFDKIAAAHRRAAASRARLHRVSKPGVPAFSSCWNPAPAAAADAAAGGGGATLSRFDLKTRKSEKLADGVACVRPLRQRRQDAAAHGRRRRRGPRRGGRGRRRLRTT